MHQLLSLDQDGAVVSEIAFQEREAAHNAWDAMSGSPFPPGVVTLVLTDGPLRVRTFSKFTEAMDPSEAFARVRKAINDDELDNAETETASSDVLQGSGTDPVEQPDPPTERSPRGSRAEVPQTKSSKPGRTANP